MALKLADRHRRPVVYLHRGAFHGKSMGAVSMGARDLPHPNTPIDPAGAARGRVGGGDALAEDIRKAIKKLSRAVGERVGRGD